jgi:hypothetical protein
MQLVNDPTASESPQPERLRGRRFYSPGWIAAYSLLCAPIGLSLYGINVARRGQRVLGGIWIALAGIAVLALVVAASKRERRMETFLVGVVLAIVLFRVEQRPYERALAQGGIRAAWWPPWLCCLGAALAIGVLLTILEAV